MRIEQPLLVACLLLTACLAEPADPGEPGETVVILLESAPRDLDPRVVGDGPSTKVSKLIFCSLTTVETEDLVPRLEAAESVRPACPEGDEGCTHWVVRVRKGIYWHDGVEVAAEDVVFTYRSIIESNLASPFRGPLQRNIRRVWEKDGEVHFQLNMPIASFPLDLSIGLVPEHILAPRGGLAARFEDDYVGCGPFRFVSRYRDQKVVLKRNEHYFEPVGPKYVVVRTVNDEATRILSVMAGSGHIVVNSLSPPVVRRLAENPEVTVSHRPAASVTYLSFNLLDHRLADPRVRKAIAHGIDREGIVREQFRGMATDATSILPPVHWAYNDNTARYPYDPSKARGLLDEAGLTPDPETGFRTKVRLKVTTDRFRRNIGAIIAHGLAEVGIEVELIPLELSTFLSDVRKGNYEMYILQAPEVLEPDILRWFFHSQAAPFLEPLPEKSAYGAVDRQLFPPKFSELTGPFAKECEERWFPLVHRQAFESFVRKSFGLPLALGNGNRSFFFDPDLDCLLDLGYSTMNRERRLGYYLEAQRIIADAIPVLPLWHEDNVAVIRNELAGFRLLPINRFSPVSKVEIWKTP